MRIEVNVPIDRSADDRGGDTPAERGSRDLAFPGISDDAAWSIMVKYARALVADRYEYDLFGENSNAFVAALMKAAGGTPEAMLPRGVTADEAIGFSHWREIVRDVAPPGDGVFRGTGGADVFQFAAGEGRDRILDFAEGVDRIRITDPAVDSLADLAVRPKGSGTEIGFGGTVIEIAGLDHHAFGLADLILVDPLIG
jgi:Ca2+-binding RTX toxin-like protein